MEEAAVMGDMVYVSTAEPFVFWKFPCTRCEAWCFCNLYRCNRSSGMVHAYWKICGYSVPCLVAPPSPFSCIRDKMDYVVHSARDQAHKSKLPAGQTNEKELKKSRISTQLLSSHFVGSHLITSQCRAQAPGQPERTDRLALAKPSAPICAVRQTWWVALLLHNLTQATITRNKEPPYLSLQPTRRQSAAKHRLKCAKSKHYALEMARKRIVQSTEHETSKTTQHKSQSARKTPTTHTEMKNDMNHRSIEIYRFMQKQNSPGMLGWHTPQTYSRNSKKRLSMARTHPSINQPAHPALRGQSHGSHTFASAQDTPSER